MPRKPNMSKDAYNDPFPTALRELMRKSNTTQEELKEVLGVSRQMISQYSSGSSAPSLAAVVKIAQFFHVSADYLLGLSDAPTDDKDTQFICDKTGLSQEAVKKITGFTEKDGLTESLNRLLEANVLSDLLDLFNYYVLDCKNAQKIIDEWRSVRDHREEGLSEKERLYRVFKWTLDSHYGNEGDFKERVDLTLFRFTRDAEKLLNEYYDYDDILSALNNTFDEIINFERSIHDREVAFSNRWVRERRAEAQKEGHD